ncbi:hypothetical protein NC651_004032 [Populus alba x Populus x berolinensis]|nr:hypothetical protein NC651_004032 [Populus alba x Populus x berolinensis]
MDTMISQSASLYMSKLAPWKEIDTTHLVLKQKNCSCEVASRTDKNSAAERQQLNRQQWVKS